MATAEFSKFVGILSAALLQHHLLGFEIAQLVKNLPAMQETLVRFLGWEGPLGKGKDTHSSILGLPLWLSW